MLATNGKGLAFVGEFEFRQPEPLLGFVLLLMLRTNAWLYSSSWNKS
jgi:hypothetical protein